jgi:hypothetical protein
MNGAGTQSEYGEMQEFAAEQFEYPGETEFSGETLGESFEAGLQETGYESTLGEVGYEAESPLSETEEMEFATELLEITNEAELDHFLGKLIKGAWKGIRKVGSVVGRVARPLGGILKGIAKKALPLAAGAQCGKWRPDPRTPLTEDRRMYYIVLHEGIDFGSVGQGSRTASRAGGPALRAHAERGDS